MRLLVTGSRGQLARSLVERGAHRDPFQIFTTERPAIDLAVSGSLSAHIEAVRPDIVVNAAAYTAVDQAEIEPELAFRINRDAAGEAAAVAHRIGVPIIHLSTDYVFDGTMDRPYRENDATNPLNVYGASKLAGERAVGASNPDHLILRTAWVISPFNRNFVKTMLRLASERDEVSVVADQFGCPTSAIDLAEAILDIAERVGEREYRGLGRTWHLAGGQGASWAELARGIFAASAELGGPSAKVLDIATTAYPTPARRPASTLLDQSMIAEHFGIRLPGWQAFLPAMIAQILKAKA